MHHHGLGVRFRFPRFSSELQSFVKQEVAFTRVCRSRRFLALATLLFAAAPLRAQSPEEAERPLVEEVALRGVHDVDRGELQEGLATQATSCRSLVLRPFCWVSDAGLFVERRYLDREELAADELRVRVFLWRRGFRDARVASRVEPAGDGVRVVFDVEQGAPTLTRSVTVRQARPVLEEEQVGEVDLPERGEPLNVIELESAKARLLAGLWERGFADAEVRDTVQLAEAGRAADVAVVLEPGRRTTIGEIVVLGNEKVSERTIRNSLDLRPGEVYRRDEVLRAQRDLYGTNLFRTALIDVPAQQDTAKRVRVTVEEAPLRALRAGVGFNTIDFAQLQAGFTRYNWLGGGRRLELRGTVGNLLAPQLNGAGPFTEVTPELAGERNDAFLSPTWQASAEVTQPAFRSPRNSYGVGVFAHRRIVPEIVVDQGYGANASFTRRLAERVPASLRYRFELTEVETGGDVYFCVNYGVCDPPTIAALRGRQRLSPLGVSVFADRADDPLAPTSGFTARFDAEHASAFTASDFRFNRVSGEVARYLGVGPGVLAGRVRGGWVRPLEGTAEALGVSAGEQGILHPRERFYAGGARSVRGYGENQLGPRILTIDPEALLCTETTIRAGMCDPGNVPSSEFDPRPLGGTTLVEANLEYRFPVWGEIGGAVFVDAARVGSGEINLLAEGKGAVTPGFGVRYQSPVGPIRVDLGIKPTLADQLPVVTQIEEPDGSLRIVPLGMTKEYDPLEDASGWGQVLQRLTLHLSIGEAF